MVPPPHAFEPLLDVIAAAMSVPLRSEINQLTSEGRQA